MVLDYPKSWCVIIRPNVLLAHTRMSRALMP